MHVVGFYRYAEEEGVIEHSPAVHIRRPRIDYESHVAHLDRNELGAILVAAGLSSPRDHALVSLLALNGLRVSEAIGANIEALGQERGHRTLTVLRKGGKLVTMPLGPAGRPGDRPGRRRTTRRSDLHRDHGQRLDRHAAGRIVRRIARRAGIAKRVGPHTLRHAFITAALDAGVPLRDVQEAASHADPRTTMRYDRGRQSLDRHATYIVATFVAGAGRRLTRVRRTRETGAIPTSACETVAPSGCRSGKPARRSALRNGHSVCGLSRLAWPRCPRQGAVGPYARARAHPCIEVRRPRQSRDRSSGLRDDSFVRTNLPGSATETYDGSGSMSGQEDANVGQRPDAGEWREREPPLHVREHVGGIAEH